MICPHCKANVRVRGKFCPVCGQQVLGIPTQQSAPQVNPLRACILMVALSGLLLLVIASVAVWIVSSPRKREIRRIAGYYEVQGAAVQRWMDAGVRREGWPAGYFYWDPLVLPEGMALWLWASGRFLERIGPYAVLGSYTVDPRNGRMTTTAEVLAFWQNPSVAVPGSHHQVWTYDLSTNGGGTVLTLIGVGEGGELRENWLRCGDLGPSP